jgi:hypothetical protein
VSMFEFDSDAEKSKPKNTDPWWNDGEKVAGLATTLIVLTFVAIICLGAVALAINFFF